MLGLLGFVFGMGGLFVVMLSGAGGGRPLRIQGRLRHPDLRAGADGSRGDRPDVAGLDATTCQALEALWLRDAQKEHASVLEWALSHGGAPVERAVHRALLALHEISRPTATSRITAPLVSRADAVRLEGHGRIADRREAERWTLRLAATMERARRLGALQQESPDTRVAAA